MVINLQWHILNDALLDPPCICDCTCFSWSTKSLVLMNNFLLCIRYPSHPVLYRSLTHWALVMQISYVLMNQIIVGGGNDLAPIWYQAITLTNASVFSIRPQEQTSIKFESECKKLLSTQENFGKYHLQNVSHFVQASVCEFYGSLSSGRVIVASIFNSLRPNDAYTHA